MPWSVYNSTGKLLQSLAIGDDSIVEGKLDVSNAPTNGYFLQAQSGEGGGLTWAAAAATAPVFGRVVRTAGSITTTSTVLVDVTGATVTLTTGNFPVRYSALQSFAHSSNAGNSHFNVAVDGTLELGSSGIRHHKQDVNSFENASFSGLTAALSAGSHVIKMQWNVGNATGTLLATSGTAHVWAVNEVR
jgi:hypothetical protein